MSSSRAHRPDRMKKWPLGIAVAVSLCTNAAAEVVVVVSAKSPVASMTKEQVAAIFTGKVGSFPGGSAAAPVDLPEGNPAREEFYSKVVGKSGAEMKSYWAKLSFTGKGTPPKEIGGSAELKKQVAADPSMVAYIDKAAVDAGVKVLFAAP